MDVEILQNCLEGKPRGWENFVDRYMGLVFHVIDHVCQTRSPEITPEQRVALCEMVFVAFRHDHCNILKRFRGTSSPTGFLTVVARRIVLRHFTGVDPGPVRASARRDNPLPLGASPCERNIVFSPKIKLDSKNQV